MGIALGLNRWDTLRMVCEVAPIPRMPGHREAEGKRRTGERYIIGKEIQHMNQAWEIISSSVSPRFHVFIRADIPS